MYCMRKKTQYLMVHNIHNLTRFDNLCINCHSTWTLLKSKYIQYMDFITWIFFEKEVFPNTEQ